MQFTCILFDLDGTLLDTASDLISALNHALRQEGLSSVSAERIKPYISHGAAAMVRHSLNGTFNDEIQEKVLELMLNDYRSHISDHTKFFSGMGKILDTLENRGIKWGIVTNKRERFTFPLMDAFNLTSRAACIVCGDTTANSKPHPDPMLAACKQAGVNPHQCLYIGDSANDIKAGKSAGMKTMAAAYGYLKPDDDPDSWNADALIKSPDEILPWIDKKLCH